MTSNIGVKGVDSIRIKGQRIEDLPLGTGNQAAEQLADAIETERLNAIAEVNAKYPSHRVDFLTARIAECHENKNRMRRFIASQHEKISEYRELVTKCKVRDKFLANVERELQLLKIDNEEFHQRRKEIYRDWGRWDESELDHQIELFREAIATAENVLAQEDKSIEEFSEVVSLCKQRDLELARLGAKAAGS